MEAIRGYSFFSTIAILLAIFISSCKTKSDITTVNKALYLIKKREYSKLKEFYNSIDIYAEDMLLQSKNLDTASVYLNLKDCKVKINSGKKFHSNVSNVYVVNIQSRGELKCKLVFFINKYSYGKISSFEYCRVNGFCVE